MVMRTGKFEVFKSKDGYRWRLKSVNGKVVAQSEGYTRHAGALKACQAVFDASHGATIYDLVKKA